MLTITTSSTTNLTTTEALSSTEMAIEAAMGSVMDTLVVHDPQVWALDPNLGDVSPFRGSTSYAYPIGVPSMPDGLQPSLSLVYSSAAADQGAEDINSLGKGWSMDFPRITQGVDLWVECQKWVDANCVYYLFRMGASGNDPRTNGYGLPTHYQLHWGGQVYDLIAKGNGEYVTSPYQPLRLWLCSINATCNGFPAPGSLGNQIGSYWQLQTPDGALYLFGTDGQSERYFHVSDCTYNRWNERLETPQIDMTFAQAWYLRRVYDTVRDDRSSYPGRWTAEYNYTHEATVNGTTDCNLSQYDPEERLTSIRYGNSLYRQSTGQEQYAVGFGYQSTSINGKTVRQPQTISVTAFGTTLYTYTLSYNTNHSLSTLRRDERDGVQNTLVSLPSTTFEYSSTLTNTLMTAVNNNYGGRTVYAYESDASTTYHRVVSSTVTTGLDNWTKVTGYQYAGACYDSQNSPCATPYYWVTYSNALLGYSQVTQTVRSAATGGSILAMTSLSYATDLRRLGQMLQSRTRDANLTILQSQQTDYQVSTNTDATFSSLPAGAWFVAPQTQTAYLAGDIGSSPNKQVTYKYDGYGSPTVVHDYGLNTTSTDDRSTVRQYVSNTTNWIIDMLAREDTYAGYTESFGTPLAGSESFYDGATAITTAPTYGKSTRIDQWLNGQWVTTKRAAYDTFGNPTIITDALGNATRAAYDPSGSFVLTTTSPLNRATNYNYYGVNGIGVQDGSGATFGQLRKATDANGAVTTYRYDPHGRLTQVIRPYDGTSAPSTVYTYTDTYNTGGLQGLKVETCQREVSGNAGACQTTLQFYDGLGRLVQSRAKDVGGQVVQNTRYDALGRATWTQVPVTETTSQDFNRPSGWDSRPGTTTRYDALGRTVAVTGADGMVVQTGYLGLTTIVTDANGHRKDSASDADGHLQSVVEYNGAEVYTTRYQYDVLGNLRVVTDALNNTTVMTYDNLSRKVGMNDPDMGLWSYAYDLNGNMTAQTDAKGQTVWFGYDALNRLTQKRQDSSSGTVLAQYGYDQGTNSIGHRTAITNANATMSWTYDLRGRVGIETKAFTGITGTFSSFWRYDDLDRVTQTRLPNGEYVTTSYDAAGRSASLNAGSQTLIASATYNAQGQPMQIAYANQTSTRYRYYGLNVNPAWANQNYGQVRQICVNTTSAGNCADDGVTGETATILMNLVYEYDSVGNVSTLRDRSPSQGNTEAFTYDPLDRLVSASGAYAQSYSYNAIGNFVSKAGVTQAYGATQPHAVRSLSDGSSFQYDANGNMTQRTEMSGTQLIIYQQQWDIDNHLVVVTNTNTGQVTQYFYDADGNRVKRIGPQGTTVYVNADYEVTGPSQMVTPTFSHKLYLPIMACASSDGSGGPSLDIPTMNLASARVTYRFNSQQVAVRGNSTLTFVYGDHLGSASLTTNISGTKISEVRYYPFGETRYSSGTTSTTKRFNAKEQQTDIGLYDYGARFFDPTIGRFVSADSVVPRPGDSQALNRYTYARNSPLVRVDPSGHGDCNVHTTSGCLPWNVDPEFGGTDFLGSLNRVNASTSYNPYDPYGIATNYVPGAAMVYGVPPEYIAAAMNYENEPEKMPLGPVTRAVKRWANPMLQIFDRTHDNNLGYSQGIGNTKPGRARETEQYYLDYYDPQSPEYKMAFMLRMASVMGYYPEQQASFAAFYVAADLRRQINGFYGMGYNGPISKEGAARIMSGHNKPGSPYSAGRYGVALIVNSSTNNIGLPFLKR